MTNGVAKGSTFRTKELAEALNVKSTTIASWTATGCPVVRKGSRGRGNHTLYDLEAVRSWLAARERHDDNTKLVEFSHKVSGLVSQAAFEAFQDLVESKSPDARTRKLLAELAATIALRASLDLLEEIPGAPTLSAWPDKITQLRMIYRPSE